MKSADEIKKRLEEEIPVHYHIDGEPRLTPRLLMDMQWLHKDTLALIQQLQDDNAQLNRCIENMTDKLNAMNDEAAKLQTENAQLLRDVHGKCGACKWMYADGFERVCDPCLSEIQDNFEWRGVQKEDDHAES